MESYFVRITNIITGLFFVIEGFLDIVLPTERRSPPENEPSVKPPTSNMDSLYDVETASSNGDSNISNIGSPKESSKPSAPSASGPDSSMKGRQPLFTIKPGGIAGYLGKTVPVG
jgi:lysophospholipid hydrolase